MLEKIKYTNSRGESVEFGQDGRYANYSDLRDYGWSYSADDRYIKGIYRDVKKASLPCVFVGADAREKRNTAFEIFEHDVVAKRKGKLEINGWYLNCFIMGTQNAEYLEDRYMKTTFDVVTDDPVWRQETLISFSKGVEIVDDGMDYPYDYPYDYAARRSGARTITSPFRFPSDFKLTIYGPATRPQIVIGGHVYQINEDLLEYERVEIDSVEKTITHFSASNRKENWFAKRYKPESIFEKLPAGVSTLSWDGSFGFDMAVYGERSEPPFVAPAHKKDEEPTYDGAYETPNGVYMLADGAIYQVST